MKSTRPFILTILLAGLAGCGTTGGICGDPGTYMDAEAGRALVIPGGLDAPPSQLRATIPEGADIVHPELRGQGMLLEDGTVRCLDRPPPGRGLHY